MQNANKIIKGFFLALAVVVLTATLVYVDQQLGEEEFQAAIIGIGGTTGEPGDGWSPLESTRACTDRQVTRLRVEGAPTTYDWSVEPTGFNILRDPATGDTEDSHSGVGKEIDVVSPNAADLSTIPTSFTVNVAPGGGYSGATFEIQVSPSCVERLDFLQPDPSRPVVPQDGQVEVQQIRATLTNGVTYTYDSNYFSNLELRFLQQPGDKQVSSVVELPLEHPEITIDMEAGGDNVAPIHVPTASGQFVEINEVSSGIFELQSDRVNPDSLIVLTANGGSPGDYLEPNIDYVFNNVAPDDDPSTNDGFELLSSGSYSGSTVHVAYAYASDEVVNATTPLTVAPTSCETLQTGIFQGRGQGFAIEDESITPATGAISKPFDFGVNPTNIILRNPSATGDSFGQQAFEIIVTMNPDLVSRASLDSSESNLYEISVRQEDNTAETANNFAYAINNVMGATSPFIAYIDPTDTDDVILYTLEIGSHTNSYECSIDGNSVTGCFTGGSDASGGETVVDPPRPLDPIIPVGEKRLIYTRGGVGAIDWRTSDASVLDIEPVIDSVNEDEQLGNEHILFSAALQTSDFDLPVSGYIQATNCEYEEVGDPPVEVLRSCDLVVNAEVTYNFPSVGYPITIIPPLGNPIQGTIQGSSMVGTLNGSATIDSNVGGVIQATGTLSGSVGGAATGGVEADVTMNIEIGDFTDPDTIENEASITSVTGTITKSDSLVPTQRSIGGENQITSTFALLTAKERGNAIIFANDATGCTVPIEVEVVEKELDVQFADEPPTFFEPGDQIQLQTFYDGQEVTNFTTFEVDEGDIASVSDTGLVRALKPGTTNITARYNTGDSDVGEVRSLGRIQIQVSEVEGLTISLDKPTIDRLPQAVHDRAYAAAVVSVNRGDVVGQAVTLEGTEIPITLPAAPAGGYIDEKARIEAITDELANQINTNVTGITVTPHPTQVGVLILRPTGSNEEVTITTTANPEDLSILPSISAGINLPSEESYGLQVIGEYNNGLTRKLDIADVTFKVSPINRLDDTALDAGRLEVGEESGTSRVVAVYERADGVTVSSNEILVTVAAGPSIDFVRILGSEAITQGSRVNLSVRVNDDETISDIQDIRVWLVRSAFNTYNEINNDPDADWFDVQTFEQQIEVTEEQNNNSESSSDSSSADTEESDETAFNWVESLIPFANAQQGDLSYRIYEIPVEIPVNSLITDGSYKLILEITDVDGRTIRHVIPITIGQVAQGDITGDGQVNMIDVITGFRIVSGQLTPTNAQLQAGNLDGRGGISMIDVILLFRQITQ